jgi:hypothetical protein
VIRWNGSATCTASGGIVSNARRHGPDRSGTAQQIASRHLSGMAASHSHNPVAVRPSITSKSWPRDTSTIEVD